MKEKFQILNFKSLIIFAAFCITTIVTIFAATGFEIKSSLQTIISLALTIIFCIYFIVYAISIRISYYSFKKCKNNEVGVLFIIKAQTSAHYESIKNKLIDNFKSLSKQYEVLSFKSIILSEKNIQVFKKIEDKAYQTKLIDKSNCKFCVFFSSKSVGIDAENCDYQLQLQMGSKYPPMNPLLSKIIDDNFSQIIEKLQITTLNAKNDLDDLKNIGTQLFYVCQYIFAMSMYFSRHTILANLIFSNLYETLNRNKINMPVYAMIRYMGGIFLLESCFLLLKDEYEKYVQGGAYNCEEAKRILDIAKLCLERDSLRSISMFPVDYGIAKSVYHFIFNRDILNARKELLELEKSFQNHPERGVWQYSLCFLKAYENNSLWQIEKEYEKIANNNYVINLSQITAFIDRVIKEENKLGLKVALLCIYRFRDDLSVGNEEIMIELKEDILQSLNSKTQNDFYKHIKSIKINRK